jgi:hypothetical protein
VAFLPTGSGPPTLPRSRTGSRDDAFEAALASAGGLSVGIMSASQGAYSPAQLLLDISQGARIASSAYTRALPPKLYLIPQGAGAGVAGWRAVRRRAEDAPQLLRPGLLASRVPGGAAYAGISGADHIDAVAAADRNGHVAAVSLGTAQTLLSRAAALSRQKRLLVVDLAGGVQGYRALEALNRQRPPGGLLIVVQRIGAASAHQLLWVAAAGLKGAGGRELSSATTNERGLLAAVDLAPTILEHLGLTPIPPAVRGDPIHTGGPLQSASLRSLERRLEVVGGRRLQALAFLLLAWALLLLGSARWGPARAWALRTGALGVLWAPAAVLIPAALEPSAAVEYATIVLACMLLGAFTDALFRWPRAPLAPAIAVLAAIVVDALAHTQLLVRSVLGPNPILGARFYGIGNELKSGLAVLVLAAVAAALYPTSERAGVPAGKRRRAAIAMVAAGVLLAVIEGSARIGAGVGGVILVSAGFAVATLMLTEGTVTRRRALLVLLTPAAALVALAALDLLTAHGSGHYTGSILHARSAGDLRDVIVRRYSAAWGELHNHAMPVATAIALLCSWLGLRRRERLLAPVAQDPVWQAAFAGGLTAGVVGALVEDSGPVLLVVAVFALGCLASYLWGRPPQPSDADPGARAG